ncbi:ribokinase [Paenibacillus alkalitolerans]|uniref:ribokinase n=1 Tax=Paenibacillus alkalitolerans TaxID=2799335 RepID=UPI0018F3D3FD|nr:ribokinase [Paenibacillus alkalitolerans]
MSILVIGSFMMDLVVRTERAPEAGETIIGTSFGRFPGGKGANQAVAAARLGGSVCMAGMLGKDMFGEEMRAVMEKESIDTRHILNDEHSSTGVGSIVLDKNGQNRIIVVPGANLKYTAGDVDNIESVIQQADMLIMQLEMDISVMERAAEIAAGHGVPVILNPAPAQRLSDELLRNVTYLTPNETELELLTGIKPASMDEVKYAAQLLLDKGVKHIVVTLAEKGALVSADGGFQHVEGFPVEPVDTVAAGDSFNGALAVRLVQGKSLVEAARYANAVGALTVTKLGAIPSLPYASEVERFIEGRIKVGG